MGWIRARCGAAASSAVALLASGCGRAEPHAHLPVARAAPPAAAPAAEPAPALLRFAGCGVVREGVAAVLAEAWQRESGQRVVSLDGGSDEDKGGLLRALVDGTADVGGAGRHQYGSEAEQRLVFHAVAWDALVVAVHPDNAVDAIGQDQLRAVLLGRLTDWRELGRPAAGAIAVQACRPEESLERMQRVLLFGEPARELAAAQVHATRAALEERLGGLPDGLAVTSWATARRRGLKCLRLDGHDPGRTAIDRAYPLLQPLFLVTGPHSGGPVHRFVDFAQSRGQELLAATGLLPLSGSDDLWRRHRARLRRSNPGTGR